MRMLVKSLAAVACVALGGTAWAADFPSKPITIVVPFQAGGTSDVVARLLGERLSDEFGQPVVVENKAGGGGSIGAAAVAQAPADGYTLMLATAGHAGLGALYPGLSFDPVTDFRPIIGILKGPIVIAVSAESEFHSLQDLIDAAKAEPGTLNCAGGGGGATVTNLAFEVIKSEFDAEIEPVSYKGSAPAVTALVAGEIDCDSDTLASVLPMVKDGKLRALAVTTAERSPLLPDVPTVAESGLPDFDASIWFGILAPAGTPDDVAAKLGDAFKAAIDDPSVTEKITALTMTPTGSSGAEFGKLLASETERWSAVIEDLGLQP